MKKIIDWIKKYWHWLVSLFTVLSLLGILLTPPHDSPRNFQFSIEKGESVSDVANKLAEANLIRSTDVFKILVSIFDHDKQIVSGTYVFSKPAWVIKIIDRIAWGEFGIGVVEVTLTEGMTRKEMAEEIAKNISGFNKEEFLQKTEGKEGYLFPDTYKFFTIAKPEEVIKVLDDNFDSKIKSIEEEIKKSPYTLEQIITMASIVEKEATEDSRTEVANILWKRYGLDMALQVDAPFVYVLGKGTFELTKDDLKTDSPFNTYVNLGLTPTPISNPGLDSIKASANPKSTRNFYFLTGADGKMYYAQNFEQHKRNRELYLNK
jgi:UPF0755 protein